MATYNCYIDKESSTLFEQKLYDKKTNKRIIVKLESPTLKLNYWMFIMMASGEKGIYERDGKVEIVINGIKSKETKSAIFVVVKNTEDKYKLNKLGKGKKGKE